jgi:hypothetical protein
VYNGNFCPNCGAPTRQSYPPIPETQKQDKPVLAIIALSLLGSLCLFILGIFMLNLVFDNRLARETNNKPSIQKAEDNKSDFQKITRTTPEQETEILKILKACGIDEIESISADKTFLTKQVKKHIPLNMPSKVFYICILILIIL